MSPYSAMVSELEKIAATIKQLEEGVRRVPGILRTTHPMAQMAGAMVNPVKRQLRHTGYAGAESFQRNLLGPNAYAAASAAQADLRRLHPDIDGKIVALPNVGNYLHPGVKPRVAKDLDTVAIMHEALERKGTPGMGLHTLGTETKDFNLISRLRGGSRENKVRKSIQELREPEFAHLRGRLAEEFNDPRASQFAEMGQRIPKAMRKAYSRSTVAHTSPEAAAAIGAQQTPVLLGRYRGAGLAPSE